MGCVDKVTQALNGAVGDGNWEVDLQSPDKSLTVKTEDAGADTVVAALATVGYKAEAV